MQTNIDAKEVMGRAVSHYRKYNDSLPEKREDRCGKQKVKMPIKTTFNAILKFFLNGYKARLRQNPRLSVDDYVLWTNNVDLAAHLDCHPKTVYRHIRILVERGIIKQQDMGSKSNFKVWITPEILHGNPHNFSEKKRLNFAPSATKETKSPPLYTQSNTLKNETRDADMFISKGNDNQGNRGQAEAATSPNPEGEQLKSGGGGRRQKSEIVAENEQKRLANAEKTMSDWAKKVALMQSYPTWITHWQKEFLIAFWKEVTDVLFQGSRWTSDQEKVIFSQITESVYGNFKHEFSTWQWVEHQKDQFEKIRLVAHYLNTHPDANLSDPYPQNSKRPGYFDINNKNGFVFVDKWLRANKNKAALENRKLLEKKRKRQEKLEGYRRVFKNDFVNLHHGLPLRKEIKPYAESLSELYKFWENKFRAFGKNNLDVFYTEYLELAANKFRLPEEGRGYRQINRIKKGYDGELQWTNRPI